MHMRQQAGFAEVFRALELGITAQLANYPTGVGKTLFGAHVAGCFQKTLFLVHFEELYHSSRRTFSDLYPKESIGTIWGKQTELDARFTIGMIGTVANRLADIPPDTFDQVIVDEAHHSTSPTWSKVIHHFKPQLLLGLSATPERNDNAPLSNLFQQIVYSMTIKEAIAEGFLVRPLSYVVQTNMPLKGLRKRGDDFDPEDLNRLCNSPERNKLILETFLAHGRNRKGIAFTGGVQHAKDLAHLFQSNGIPAEAVWGDDGERKSKLERHRANQIQLLFNSNLLMEGYDDPSIDLGMMLRPMFSRPMYMQGFGRPLRLLRKGRTWSGNPKIDALWFDFMDVPDGDRFDLVSAWDFFGQSKPVSTESPVDLMLSEEQRDLEQKTKRSKRFLEGLPPEQQALISLEGFLRRQDLLEGKPHLEEWIYGEETWHQLPPTPKQLDRLVRAGFSAESDWTRGQASAAIRKLPASTEQKALLLALGFNTLTQPWSVAEAETAIERATKEGRKPNYYRVENLMPTWINLRS